MAYDGTYLAGPSYMGGKQGHQLWIYTTTDSAATIAGAAYITDANTPVSGNRGMKKGDSVIVIQVTTLPDVTPLGVSVYIVSVLSTTTGFATLIKTATA